MRYIASSTQPVSSLVLASVACAPNGGPPRGVRKSSGGVQGCVSRTMRTRHVGFVQDSTDLWPLAFILGLCLEADLGPKEVGFAPGDFADRRDPADQRADTHSVRGGKRVQHVVLDGSSGVSAVVEAVGGGDMRVELREVTSGEISSAPEFVLAGAEATISSVDFSPDDTLVAAGTLDGTVLLWRVPDRARGR